MRTAELTGAALDWAVAMAENWAGADFDIKPYSTDWSQGGPIIERSGICIFSDLDGAGDLWAARMPEQDEVLADTPLIAAMRCYVASKLGDTVEIPGELENAQA